MTHEAQKHKFLYYDVTEISSGMWSWSPLNELILISLIHTHIARRHEIDPCQPPRQKPLQTFDFLFDHQKCDKLIQPIKYYQNSPKPIDE